MVVENDPQKKCIPRKKARVPKNGAKNISRPIMYLVYVTREKAYAGAGERGQNLPLLRENKMKCVNFALIKHPLLGAGGGVLICCLP